MFCFPFFIKNVFLLLCITNHRGIVLSLLLFLLYKSENNLSSYLDNTSFIAVVPTPGVRVTLAESLNLDIGKVSEWCDLWGMKLNASKSTIVSRSRTMHSQSLP